MSNCLESFGELYHSHCDVWGPLSSGSQFTTQILPLEVITNIYKIENLSYGVDYNIYDHYVIELESQFYSIFEYNNIISTPLFIIKLLLSSYEIGYNIYNYYEIGLESQYNIYNLYSKTYDIGINTYTPEEMSFGILFERSLLGLYDGMMVFNLIRELFTSFTIPNPLIYNTLFNDILIPFEQQYQGIIDFNIYNTNIYVNIKTYNIVFEQAEVRQIEKELKLVTINGIFKFRKFLTSFILYQYGLLELTNLVILNNTIEKEFNLSYEIYEEQQLSFDTTYTVHKYSYLELININVPFISNRTKTIVRYLKFYTNLQIFEREYNFIIKTSFNKNNLYTMEQECRVIEDLGIKSFNLTYVLYNCVGNNTIGLFHKQDCVINEPLGIIHN